MKLKIGCENIDLIIGGEKTSKELSDTGRFGEAHYYESTIKVSDIVYSGEKKHKRKNIKILQTTIHEILHFLFEHYGFANNEKNIKQTTAIILQFLSDNKKVIRALLEKYL